MYNCAIIHRSTCTHPFLIQGGVWGTFAICNLVIVCFHYHSDAGHLLCLSGKLLQHQSVSAHFLQVSERRGRGGCSLCLGMRLERRRRWGGGGERGDREGGLTADSDWECAFIVLPGKEHRSTHQLYSHSISLWLLLPSCTPPPPRPLAPSLPLWCSGGSMLLSILKASVRANACISPSFVTAHMGKVWSWGGFKAWSHHALPRWPKKRLVFSSLLRIFWLFPTNSHETWV